MAYGQPRQLIVCIVRAHRVEATLRYAELPLALIVFRKEKNVNNSTRCFALAFVG